MRNWVFLGAMTLAFAFTHPALGSSKRRKIELAKSAKAPLVDSINKATAKAKGMAIEAELRKKHGRVVWEVEVLGDDGTLTEVDVSAETGEVVDSEPKK